MPMRILHVVAIVLSSAMTFMQVSATEDAADAKKRKPDLGDVVEGSYFGDVISDSEGSSRSEVTLTVTRIDRNKVRITSDYPRLPVVEVALEKAMDKILAASGDTTFLYDPAKSPAGLDVSFHNVVSWSGARR